MTLNKSSVKGERYTGLPLLLSYTPDSPCCCDHQPAYQQPASICPKYAVGQEKQAKISNMCHQIVSYHLTEIMAYHYRKTYLPQNLIGEKENYKNGILPGHGFK